MSDGQLAIVGVGSVGSMALWQASKLGIAPVGFEAVTPAHPRSAVGGDTRLFRMTYRGEHNLYPVLQLAERLWRRLEQESGQEILTQCGGLSIGETDGSYIPALLDSIRRTGAPHEILPYAEMARRYPQHQLTPNECGILDRRAGFLRTDRAVLSAVDAARENGAQLSKKCAGAGDPRGGRRGAHLDRHRPVDVRPGDRGGGLRVGRGAAAVPAAARAHEAELPDLVHGRRRPAVRPRGVPDLHPDHRGSLPVRRADGRRGDRKGHPGRPRDNQPRMPTPSPANSPPPRCGSRSRRSRRSCRV